MKHLAQGAARRQRHVDRETEKGRELARLVAGAERRSRGRGKSGQRRDPAAILDALGPQPLGSAAASAAVSAE